MVWELGNLHFLFKMITPFISALYWFFKCSHIKLTLVFFSWKLQAVSTENAITMNLNLRFLSLGSVLAFDFVLHFYFLTRQKYLFYIMWVVFFNQSIQIFAFATQFETLSNHAFRNSIFRIGNNTEIVYGSYIKLLWEMRTMCFEIFLIKQHFILKLFQNSPKQSTFIFTF